MEVEAFKLERYFARYEFAVQHLLCSSDSESISVRELLALDAQPDTALSGLLDLRLGYTETLGLPELRGEIAQLYGPEVGADDIFVTAGAEEAIFLFFTTMVRRGQAIVVHYPAYQSLFQLAESVGCEIVKWRTTQELNWELDVQSLENILQQRNGIDSDPQQRVVGIVMNCPHNPTGYCMDSTKQARIIELARQYDVFVFSDEVYRFLSHSRSRQEQISELAAACDLYEKAISLGVMSKSFGMAGLRIGWVATRWAEARRAMAQLKDYTSICSSGTSEYLSVITLRNRDKVLQRNLNIAQTNLTLLDEFFAEFSDILSWERPKGGATGFPRFTFTPKLMKYLENVARDRSERASGDQSENQPSSIELLCEDLVLKQGVLLLPGTCYDEAYADHFRLGFGRADMPTALGKLRTYLRTIMDAQE